MQLCRGNSGLTAWIYCIIRWMISSRLGWSVFWSRKLRQWCYLAAPYVLAVWNAQDYQSIWWKSRTHKDSVWHQLCVGAIVLFDHATYVYLHFGKSWKYLQGTVGQIDILSEIIISPFIFKMCQMQYTNQLAFLKIGTAHDAMWYLSWCDLRLWSSLVNGSSLPQACRILLHRLTSRRIHRF